MGKTLNPIIVIGTGRSGTSTMAGILYFLGVKMGKNFVPANDRNPVGYFENKDVVDKIKKIKNGGTGFHKVIAELNDYAKPTPWGVKVPRLVDFIDELKEAFPKAQYVIITRGKQKTLNSMMKTMSEELANETYERRVAAVKDIVENQNFKTQVFRLQEISTTRVRDARDIVKGIAERLKLQPTDEQVELAALYLTFTTYVSQK